jgi:hypothetical protein
MLIVDNLKKDNIDEAVENFTRSSPKFTKR